MRGSAAFGNVGLIGAGALAQALADGLLAAGLDPARLWVCNRSDDARLARWRAAGVGATRDKTAVVRAADLLVLLVKPKDVAVALGELVTAGLAARHTLLSCLAGVPTAYIEETLGGRPRVIRAMPNIGSAVRASATGVAAGRYTHGADLEASLALLGAVGQTVVVDESLMDAVTAVSGSGPAYVFLLMEALIEAARNQGLPDAVARQLVLQTASGAAALAARADRSPAELRAAVSSPGGTTMAGIGVLEQAGFRESLGEAVAAAARRSRELGQAWTPPPGP